ncbi:arylamine N-acetyltransferase [Paenibacillus sp. MDMC362]|uniref:arylamine N-acetyltransferase family protein n=1 Tax=Paenibacillus sp. MDMC362 TaxID=2977365 RepID=UPI000DC4C7EA|nr:arylamine N-acetyltransferase [Paenibacillus sp. MDMC362]RAR42259.1 arylamine N-acetyltransferase [Paenibacillus sp. MDMC362]
MITQSEVRAYLNRLGISDIQEPTKEYLFELHKAHVARIPWQTLDIFAGKPTSIDIEESVQLMIHQRSGYCFHLNGAFTALLRALGYKVYWHRAGVQPLGQEPRINGFHLGITVSLWNEQLGEEERWLVDVGLGDMPWEPIPLKFGRYIQGPFQYALEPSRITDVGWRLIHDPRYSYVGVDYAPDVVNSLELFKSNHAFYSRSPESPWMDLFIVRQRHEQGMNELKGCIWRKWSSNNLDKMEISSKSEWFEILADIFHEPLVNYFLIERDLIWDKVNRQHQNWKKLMENERV